MADDIKTRMGKGPDTPSGMAYQAPMSRKVTNSKTSPKSAMMDGPYGGKKPQG